MEGRERTEPQRMAVIQVNQMRARTKNPGRNSVRE